MSLAGLQFVYSVLVISISCTISLCRNITVISKDVESLEGMSYLPVSVSFSPFENNNQQHLVSKSCQENDRILQGICIFLPYKKRMNLTSYLMILKAPICPSIKVQEQVEFGHGYLQHLSGHWHIKDTRSYSFHIFTNQWVLYIWVSHSLLL